jgi:hypothetical protein
MLFVLQNHCKDRKELCIFIQKCRLTSNKYALNLTLRIYLIHLQRF